MSKAKLNEEVIVDRRVNEIVVESIKQSLISEYLKKYPQVKRSDVIAQFIQGEWVIKSISSILQDMFQQREIRDAFQQEQILKEIEMESDDRYRACQQSIKNSKRIIDFLFQSTYAEFGLNEKNENNNYLNRQERLCAESISNHYKHKKHILEYMTEPQPAMTQLKIKMLDYFDTLHKQLDYQYKIFDREIVINNEFSKYSQNLIKEHFKNVQTKLKDSTKKQLLVNHIVKAYQTLKQSGYVQFDNGSSVSIDKFKQILNDFDNQMSKKREALESIQKIIQALEIVVGYLEVSVGKEKSIPEEEKPQPTPEKSSSLRMAFTTKITKIFTRTKKI